MKKTKTITKIVATILISSALFASCGSSSGETDTNQTDDTNVESTDDTETSSENNTLTIATTTSLYNTGLLDELETDFESKYDYDVEYIAVGSGAAMQMARDGEADGVFVHSKDAEDELVADGISLGRNSIMYNYFEIVGPEPLEATDFEGVLDEIRDGKLFVSRGDDSGTHVKELAMWGDDLPSDYIETGKGMSDTLVVASEMQGYTLTDDATFIKNQDDLDLQEIYKNNEFFKNVYSYHCINPDLNEYINAEGSEAYLEYLQSDDTLDLIASFGADEYGKPFYTLVD